MKITQSLLADDFFEIIENNEIINWESKDFWMRIDDSIHRNKSENQKNIYNLINFLSKNSCFEIKKSPTNKRINTYTENKKLRSIRNNILLEKLNDFLNEKHEYIQENIKKKKKELNFIRSLSEENPSIKNILSKHQIEYEDEIKELELKVTVIKKILKI